MTINILLQLLQAALPVVSLLFLKMIIEAVVQRQNSFRSILIQLGAWGCVQLLQVLVVNYTAYINNVQQQKLTDYLSQRVLHKATDVSYDYYEQPAYHDTLHLAQQQVVYKAPAILNSFNALILSSCTMVFLFIFLFTLKPLFALLFIVLALPLAFAKWYAGFMLTRLEREVSAKEREAHYLHHVLTNVSHAKEVRVFDLAAYFIDKFKAIRVFIFSRKRELYRRTSWYGIVAEMLEVIIITIIFGYLVKEAWFNMLAIGAFVIYWQGFQRLQTTSRSFLQGLVQMIQQSVFLRDLFSFFDLPVASQQTGSSGFPVVRDGLFVRNVSFHYPGAKKPALNNVSIRCAPGKIIAIVGENGSGKSTLVKLLARLYSLQSGTISMDNVDIASIDLSGFRANSSFLFQDFEKYFFSVGENIAFRELVTDEDMDVVRGAANLSGAHPFIERLSSGYATRMGTLFQGSEQLSGGQWQKLALARSYYRKAGLMVLDEPTSALDATAEYEVFQQLKKHVGEKMIILITHRLYSLKIADYIYFMKDGVISEEGTFAELLAAGGAFQEMHDRQQY